MAWRMELTAFCRGCGRSREPDERFSARGRCPECGIGRAVRNDVELHEHHGEHFEHWRRRVAASVGAVLVDELALGE